MAGFQSTTDVTSLEERRAQLLSSGLNLTRLLASGAFAEVYEVSRKTDDEIVRLAAKVYYELAWEIRIRHAEREFNIINELKHENILQVFDLVIQEDVIFATMELCGGGELLDHISVGQGLHVQVGQRVMIDICRGLSFLHEQKGIVHLDIKPENILLSASGQAKIADFDAALPEGTHVHVVRGTTECHPPEYVQNNSDGYVIRSQADTWALGLVLYEVVVGAYPWESPSVESDSGYASFIHHPTTSKPWMHFPPRLLDVFQRMFHDCVDERASASDLLAYLTAVDNSLDTGQTRYELDVTHAKEAILQDNDMSGACIAARHISLVSLVSAGGHSRACSRSSSLQLGAHAAEGDEVLVSDALSVPSTAVSAEKLTALIRAAWMAPLNTSSQWTCLVEPNKLQRFDTFLVVLLPPDETTKIGRVVCEERYSRLLALHRMCTGAHPRETPQKFPKKKLFGRRTSDFLRMRASKLADYFEDAVTVEECRAFYVDGCSEFYTVQGDATDPVFVQLEREARHSNVSSHDLGAAIFQGFGLTGTPTPECDNGSETASLASHSSALFANVPQTWKNPSAGEAHASRTSQDHVFKYVCESMRVCAHNV